jgi:hypothetical protein
MWFGRRPVTVEDGFDPRTAHMGFVEGKVALRWVFLLSASLQ